MALETSKEPELPLCWLEFQEDIDVPTDLLVRSRSQEFDDGQSLLRAVPLLLASVWETFHTRCADEACAFICSFASSSASLPNELKLRIGKELISDASGLSVWSLSGEGWRDVVRTRTGIDGQRLRSGKTQHLDDLYDRAIGLKLMSKKWTGQRRAATPVSERINAYIASRDGIVHRGKSHLSYKECWEFRQLLVNQVIRTVSVVDQHVRNVCGVAFSESSLAQLRRTI